MQTRRDRGRDWQGTSDRWSGKRVAAGVVWHPANSHLRLAPEGGISQWALMGPSKTPAGQVLRAHCSKNLVYCLPPRAEERKRGRTVWRWVWEVCRCRGGHGRMEQLKHCSMPGRERSEATSCWLLRWCSFWRCPHGKEHPLSVPSKGTNCLMSVGYQAKRRDTLLYFLGIVGRS